MIDSNYKYYLDSKEKGRVQIPPIKDARTKNRDTFTREKDRYSFSLKKSNKIELIGAGYEYIRDIFYGYGPRANVRLIETFKSDDSISENWIENPAIGLDLFTVDFDPKRNSVQLQSKEAGFIEEIKGRWDDEYDVLVDKSIKGTTLDPMPLQTLTLTPRRILRRSRIYVADGETVIARDDKGATARALPFNVDYSSNPKIRVLGQGADLSANDDDYATITNPSGPGAMIYLIAPRQIELTLNGIVKTQIEVNDDGYFNLDLIIYRDGSELVYDRKIQLDSCDPSRLGNTCYYRFDNYKLTLQEGESFTIGTISNADRGFLGGQRIDYTANGTELVITEDNPYPETTTEAVLVKDLFNRLIEIATGEKQAFRSEIFGMNGKYCGLLLATGNFIRNVPKVINEGQEDETKTQFKVSMKKLYEALNLPEPLMYDATTEKGKNVLIVEPEKMGQQNFSGVRLGETKNGEFQYFQVQNVKRKVIPGNYWSKIIIGSEKTGSDYGEVNNLFSCCGNSEWNTINKTDKEYKVTTQFRTGAEDAEIYRGMQWSDKPDTDSDADNDIFMFDAKKSGADYILKKWDDYYEEPPTKVYDYESNYNWLFVPGELIFGHGWKIMAGLQLDKKESLVHIGSNCNTSLVTKREDRPKQVHNGRIPHTWLEKPTVFPMEVSFDFPVNQEIELMLRGYFMGIDNKYGRLTAKNEDGDLEDFRLIKVNENDPGKWTVIEAR